MARKINTRGTVFMAGIISSFGKGEKALFVLFGRGNQAQKFDDFRGSPTT
jgi:hypothetical protein